MTLLISNENVQDALDAKRLRPESILDAIEGAYRDLGADNAAYADRLAHADDSRLSPPAIIHIPSPLLGPRRPPGRVPRNRAGKPDLARLPGSRVRALECEPGKRHLVRQRHLAAL